MDCKENSEERSRATECYQTQDKAHKEKLLAEWQQYCQKYGHHYIQPSDDEIIGYISYLRNEMFRPSQRNDFSISREISLECDKGDWVWLGSDELVIGKNNLKHTVRLSKVLEGVSRHFSDFAGEYVFREVFKNLDTLNRMTKKKENKYH